MKKVLILFFLFTCCCKAQKFERLERENPIYLMKTSLGDLYLELFIKSAPKTVENFIGLATGTKEFVDPKTKEIVKRPFYNGLLFHRVVAGFVAQGGDPLGTGEGGPGYSFEDEINANDLGLDKIMVLSPKNRLHPFLKQDYPNFYRLLIYPLQQNAGIEEGMSKEEKEAIGEKEIWSKLRKVSIKSAYKKMGFKYNLSLKSYPPAAGCLAMANKGPDTNGSQFFILLDHSPRLMGKHTVFGRVIRGVSVLQKMNKVPVDFKKCPKEPLKILSIEFFKSGKKERLVEDYILKLVERILTLEEYEIEDFKERSDKVKGKVLRVLMEDLSDEEYEVRLYSAAALGKISAPEALVAIPSLRRRLEDKDAQVRCYAARALSQIEKKEIPFALPILIESLQHKNKTIAILAAQTLTEIGKPAKKAIPTLIKFLTDEDDFLCINVAWALGEIAQTSEVSTLREALKNESREKVKMALQDALQRIRYLNSENK